MRKLSDVNYKDLREVLFGVVILGFFYSACGVNLYRRAEDHLNRQENKAALEIYLGLMKASRDKPDLKAMIGAGIAYRNLGNRKACMQLCRKILKYKPNHAAALYYLGSCLEELGMEDLAMKFYGQYNIVSRDDPYYSFLKARMNIIKIRSKDIN